MNDLFLEIFGQGKDLTPLQMAGRAVVAFMEVIVLFRISGRRSLSQGMALDTAVTILMGAVLSRGVVGVSPFAGVSAACLAIALMHRLFGYVTANTHSIGRLLKGEKIEVYHDGRFIARNMRRCLVSEHDVMASVRKALQTDSMENVESVIVERNGSINVILRRNENEDTHRKI